jgi:hypothetical protein
LHKRGAGGDGIIALEHGAREHCIVARQDVIEALTKGGKIGGVVHVVTACFCAIASSEAFCSSYPPPPLPPAGLPSCPPGPPLST